MGRNFHNFEGYFFEEISSRTMRMIQKEAFDRKLEKLFILDSTLQRENPAREFILILSVKNIEQNLCEVN